MPKRRVLPFLALILCLLIPQRGWAQGSDLDFQWVTFGTNITQISTGARFTFHDWYSETCLGGFSAFEDQESSFFLSQTFGRRFALNSWLYFGADLGLRRVIPDGSDNPVVNTGKFLTLDARLKLEAVVDRHLSFFFGGGSTRVYEGDSFGSGSFVETVVFWGVGLL